MLKKANQVEIYYRASPRGTYEPRSMEIKSAAWFGLDELPEGLSRDQRKIINRILNSANE